MPKRKWVNHALRNERERSEIQKQTDQRTEWDFLNVRPLLFAFL